MEDTSTTMASTPSVQPSNRWFLLSLLLFVGVVVQIHTTRELSPAVQRVATTRTFTSPHVSLQTTVSTKKSEQKTPNLRAAEKQHHVSGDLYVPSLRFPPSTQTRSCLPVKSLSWEWFPEEPAHRNQRKLLVALYAGYDAYGPLLDTTAHMAKVLSTLHEDITVVVLQGTAMASKCTPPGIYTTLNKIRLLFHALDQEYDQLLLLDADVLWTDLEHTPLDLEWIQSSDHLLALSQPHTAEQLSSENSLDTSLSFWNLQHRHAKDVALDWFNKASDAVADKSYDGDASYLQDSITHSSWIHTVDTSDLVLHASKGTLLERRAQLSEKAKEVCRDYNEACLSVPDLAYRAGS
eukprot:Nitzschia sp. Nitz4//scaffold115_size69933//32067//33116//NITZ4_006002-RA/size69933-processed-gene-0.118-mRNA-1//-1//CDS//3329533499//1969//frame0